MPSGDFRHYFDLSTDDSHPLVLFRAGLLPPLIRIRRTTTPQDQALLNFIPHFFPFNGPPRHYVI